MISNLWIEFTEAVKIFCELVTTMNQIQLDVLIQVTINLFYFFNNSIMYFSKTFTKPFIGIIRYLESGLFDSTNCLHYILELLKMFLYIVNQIYFIKFSQALSKLRPIISNLLKAIKVFYELGYCYESNSIGYINLGYYKFNFFFNNSIMYFSKTLLIHYLYH